MTIVDPSAPNSCHMYFRGWRDVCSLSSAYATRIYHVFRELLTKFIYSLLLILFSSKQILIRCRRLSVSISLCASPGRESSLSRQIDRVRTVCICCINIIVWFRSYIYRLTDRLYMFTFVLFVGNDSLHFDSYFVSIEDQQSSSCCVFGIQIDEGYTKLHLYLSLYPYYVRILIFAIHKHGHGDAQIRVPDRDRDVSVVRSD